jgi:thioredoxin-related protein
MRSRVVFTFLLAALLFGAYGYLGDSSAQSKSTGKQAKVSADDFWTTDWDKALAAAKSQKKPVIIDFYTDWCGWCKKLDKETYAAPEIQKRLKEGWVGVKVNPEDESKKGTLNGKVMSYAEIAYIFKVRGYPTIIFLDKEGNLVNLNAAINFVPREPFGPLLDYVRYELYKKNILLKKYVQDSMRK